MADQGSVVVKKIDYLAYPNVGSTAIRRGKLSSPVATLVANGVLDCIQDPRILDWGCGRGEDIDTLENSLGFKRVYGYDPVHQNEQLPRGKFDIVLCTYVLNVIDCQEQREHVLERVLHRLKKDGMAFVTVRRDLRRTGWTVRDTWQGMIDIPEAETFYRCSGYEIYLIQHSEDESFHCPERSGQGT